MEARTERRRRATARRWWLGVLAILAVGGTGPAATAQIPAPGGGRGAVDQIAAVVGDSPILRSEVEEQAQALAEQFQVSQADTAVYRKLHREVLDRMIENELLLLEAEAQAITADEAEVSEAVETALENTRRQLGGEEAFQAQLRREGLTEPQLRSDYREEARKQILAQKLIQREVRPRVSLSEDAARRFYEENRTELPKKPRQLRVQDLFVATRPDSVIERRALERAREVRQEIRGGLSFEQAAAKYSDDPRGEAGAVMGRFELGDLDTEMEAVAFGLETGEISEPAHSRLGFHLLRVSEKDPDGQWVELQHILLAAAPSRADEVRARESAEEIHRKVTTGEVDFLDAIQRWSDDEASKARDGDLGWIPIDRFFGEMRVVADTLRVGRVSPPVAGDGGFHIFKVIGEEAEGAYAFEEIRDQLRQYAYQEALDQELQKWLDDLRKRYYVEIRSGW